MNYERKIRKLAEYIDALRSEGVFISFSGEKDALERPVEFITFDSREACEGSLFVCKGANLKAEYLDKAAEAGAFCYVSETAYESPLPCILVSDIRRAMAVLANEFNGLAWRNYNLIGLTGTKGKSTTLYYIKAVIEAYTKKNGLGGFGFLSTIDTFDGIEFFESHLTTPEALELGKRLENGAKAGLWALGMEVSSQALKYDRSYGLEFNIGAFLNYGVDHIGSTEHPTEEDYFQSKLRFVDQCRTLCINLDSARIDEILPAAQKGRIMEKLICYSPSGQRSVCGRNADYIALNGRKENGHIAFEIAQKTRLLDRLEEGAEPGPEVLDYGIIGTIRLSMPGFFNIENALAAAVICLELGIPFDDIASALLEAKAAGRMEMFQMKGEKDVKIIVDYAHNELSYQKLFESIKEEFPGYRVEIVFGCPGGKGLDRRETLPRVTAKFADYAWITEEDPFMDDPMEISKEVLANLEKYGGKGEIIVDREQCIREAAARAADKTVLILAAKGRELYQHRGNEYVQIVSDAQLAEELSR